MSTHESLSKYSYPRSEGRGSGLGAGLGGGRDEVWFLSAGRSVNRSKGRMGQEAETSTILLPPIFLKPIRFRYPAREETPPKQSCQEECIQHYTSMAYGATAPANAADFRSFLAVSRSASRSMRCSHGNLKH